MPTFTFYTDMHEAIAETEVRIEIIQGKIFLVFGCVNDVSY